MTIGYTLAPTGGEHLVLRGGNIFIKADPRSGSNGVTMLTQQVLAGVGIPVHRHFQMDEAFYVLEGGGTVILDDARHAIEKVKQSLSQGTLGTALRILSMSWYCLLWRCRQDWKRSFGRLPVRPVCRKSCAANSN
jgi:hypothetical protein